MAIVIREKPDIELSREEYDRLLREWGQSCNVCAAPVSFETFVRRQKLLRNILSS